MRSLRRASRPPVPGRATSHGPALLHQLRLAQLREEEVAERAHDLVVFDCDGVLVDSEPISNRELCVSLNEIGFDVDYAGTIRTFKGRSLAHLERTIEERLGRPAPEDFIPRWRARVFEAFRGELRPVAGVREVLAALPVPVCVASSSVRARVELCLRLTGLDEFFATGTKPAIFTGDDVERGKPAPDLFLLAASTLGKEPARCVVIEDSAVGVEAARAAGMRALGFAGTSTANASELLDAGAAVFTEMRDLPGLLSTLSPRRPG